MLASRSCAGWQGSSPKPTPSGTSSAGVGRSHGAGARFPPVPCRTPAAPPRRGRIDRRAAARTERLQAWIAALGRGLEVCRRLARYAKGRTGNRNINAEGGAGADLAIRAVANRGLLRVGFAFYPDIAVVARAVDFHEFVPFTKSG